MRCPCPAGVDEAAVRGGAARKYDLEIGAGLGAMAGKIWRIGLMGYASIRTNVLFCLGALDAVLAGMQAPIARASRSRPRARCTPGNPRGPRRKLTLYDRYVGIRTGINLSWCVSINAIFTAKTQRI